MVWICSESFPHDAINSGFPTQPFNSRLPCDSFNSSTACRDISGASVPQQQMATSLQTSCWPNAFPPQQHVPGLQHQVSQQLVDPVRHSGFFAGVPGGRGYCCGVSPALRTTTAVRCPSGAQDCTRGTATSLPCSFDRAALAADTSSCGASSSSSSHAVAHKQRLQYEQPQASTRPAAYPHCCHPLSCADCLAPCWTGCTSSKGC